METSFGPGCTPTGWTLPAGGWRDGEGVSGTRAAYVEKPNSGAGTVTTAGSFALSPFTVTAPTSLTLYFDYRVVANGGGGSTKARLRFDVSDGTNTYAATPTVAATGSTGGYVADSVTIAISGTGPVTITEFNFQLEATSGQPKWIWLDNLDLRDPAGGGSVVLRQWREIVSN